MERFQGLFGVILILGIAFLASNNRKRINYRTVFSGLGLQLLVAVLVLKIPPVTRFFQNIGLGVTTDIRNDLYRRILEQSSRFHSEHPSGELVARVINDVALMQNAVYNRLLDLFQQSFTLVALLALLLSTNFRLALISLVAAPLYVIAMTRGDLALFIVFTALSTLMQFTFLGPTAGSLQNMLHPRMRATGHAFTNIFAGLVGGLGPVLVGWLSDELAGAGFPSDIALGYAMAGAGLISLWAAGHYLLAARTLGADLARVREGRA